MSLTNPPAAQRGTDAVRPGGGLLDRLQALSAAQHGGWAVVVNPAGLPLLAGRADLCAAGVREVQALARRLDLPCLNVGGDRAVVVCRPARIAELEQALGRLASLLGAGQHPMASQPMASQPMASQPMGAHSIVARRDGAEGALAVCYDLGSSDERAALEERLAPARSGTADGEAADGRLRPLVVGDVARVTDALADVPIEGLLRRQHALVLAPAARPRPLLCEAYVSIGALAGMVAPGIDLLAQPAMFRFLTRALDARVLRTLAGVPPPAVRLSVNLNILSIGSAEFAALEDAWQATQRPIIEIQLAEILADLVSYARLRDALRGRGYLVLIDGVGVEALARVALDRLQPDLVKVLSLDRQRAALPGSVPEALRARIAALGSERVVLARTESEDALRWGLSLGITRFQGFFVDRLVQAIARRSP